MRDVEVYWSRKRQNNIIMDNTPRTIHLFIVPLPFTLPQLGDLNIFKSFQRLLWYTRVHYNSCFDTGMWSPDERGVYCRSNVLVAGLSNLSKLHNILVNALNHLQINHHDEWWTQVRAAFGLHRSIVQTSHHRQIPDLLAVASLLEERKRPDIRSLLTQDLHNWALLDLAHNDPRKRMFEELVRLPVDPDGHMYLAYDAFCRQIWMARAGGSDFIKAYYAYNQASLPRLIPGQFFSLFQGKKLTDINLVLQEIDEKFTAFDNARITLWHTAIRYCLKEQRYNDAETIANKLLLTLAPFELLPNVYLDRQLNANISLTYTILGLAQSEQRKLGEAMENFGKSVFIRSGLVHRDEWDAILVTTLEKLECLAIQTGTHSTALSVRNRLYDIHEAMKARDHSFRSSGRD